MNRKVVLLSNVTVDMIAIKLRKKYEVYVPEGFDTWVAEVLNNQSGLYTSNYDAVFLILDGTEFRYENNETVQDRIALWKCGVQRLVEKVKDNPVFITTVDFQESRIKTYAERKQHIKLNNDWYEFIQELCELNTNVYVLDMLDMIMDIGRKRFYSSKMWYLGSMPYSKEGISCIVSEIESAMEAMTGQRKKVLVLDLDNTLWGGIIGEDGIENIELSDHGKGARFYNFQRQIMEMKKRGVVLAINSKNNESDAEEAFAHPDMVLQKNDFVNMKLNWQDKATNMKEMEKELNLTEEAFVFIDDNPMERAYVGGQCTDITVAEFPDDTTELPDFIEEIYMAYFLQSRTTDEDLNKTRMYQEERKRKESAGTCGMMDFDDYIRQLEIKADIHRMRDNELERVHQLCNKTNQFNLTTKRYGLQEIRELNSSADIFTVSMKDKFGDNGLVSVIICKRDKSDMVIDTFLMSCRVMGRKLENVIMEVLVQKYSDFERMIGFYVPTNKNAPVKNLYEKLGFDMVEESGGIKRYELSLGKLYQKTDCYDEVRFETCRQGGN